MRLGGDKRIIGNKKKSPVESLSIKRVIERSGKKNKIYGKKKKSDT